MSVKEYAELDSWFQDFKELTEKQPTIEKISQNCPHICGKIRRRKKCLRSLRQNVSLFTTEYHMHATKERQLVNSRWSGGALRAEYGSKT